jgi:hypothetical protein
MDVCLRLFCVCVVLCRKWLCDGLILPSKESYRLCIGLRNWKSGQGPTENCRAIDSFIARKELHLLIVQCVSIFVEEINWFYSIETRFTCVIAVISLYL